MAVSTFAKRITIDSLNNDSPGITLIGDRFRDLQKGKDEEDARCSADYTQP